MPPATFLDPGPSKQKQNWNSFEHSPSTRKVEATVKKICNKGFKYEYLMKDLESTLADDLSNFRAIEALIQDSSKALQHNCQRADRALSVQVPQIKSDLAHFADHLTDLAESLPSTQLQLSDIKEAYDSGREKAQSLVGDLVWLNTEFYERWRLVIFTSSSPVSLRWKVLMRAIFVLSFITGSWLLWIGITGAIRAHRHRLVWGERLMS